MTEHKPPTLGELYTVHLVQELADLRQQLATVQAEREQYKAALGRAANVVRDLHAECCMPWVTAVRDQYVSRMQPVLKRAEQLCGEPEVQAAVEALQPPPPTTA